MSTPLTEGQAYAQAPTMPAAAPAGYTTPATLAPLNGGPPKTSAQLEALRGSFIELIFKAVVQVIFGFFLPGNGAAVDQLTNWFHILLPAQILAPVEELAATVEADIAAIAGQFQALLDALLSGLTGIGGTGNDLASVVLALINQGLQVPATLFDQFFAALAALQGQVTAIQNNPGGASQSDDFATVGLTAWTNVLNTLVVASGHIQTAGITAGYVGTVGAPRKPATSRCGAQVVVTAERQGTIRLLISSDVTLTNYAAVEVYSGFDGDAVRIVTGSAPDLTVVEAEVDALTSVVDLTAFDIRYDPSPNTFTVLRNNQPIGLSWVDTTNIVTHGAGKTFVAVVSNADDDPDNPGFGIKRVTFYDW